MQAARCKRCIMKVCLISPPTLTQFTERQVAESEALRLVAEHAPMGILSLAAVLEERGCTPHVIDLNRLYYDYVASGISERDGTKFFSYTVRHLEALSFDVFGFSTICSNYPLTLRFARCVKDAHPNAAVVLGGPQASVVDAATMRAYPFVDYIVRGEAEETFPQLLDAIAGGAGEVRHIPGVTYRVAGEVLRNVNAPPIEDLDSLPMPALHLYPRVRECSYLPLEAGRGCPFACSFCSTNDFFRRRFRMKSPALLVAQMRSLKESYGIDAVDLVHDMFTVDRKKVLAFCDAVEASGERFRWSCSARTDCIDDELMSRMVRAGCVGLFFGIDTGSERMQEVINKRLNLQEAAARVRRANRLKLATTVSLITGFHEETREDLQATLRFYGESLRYKYTDVQLHLLAPLAETPISTRFKGELIYDDIFSDLSFQGWEQDPEDRRMIVEHPDIFTNFYAVPTRWLDRHYFKEVREFLARGILKHRRLILLLYRDSGDLLRVFDRWRAWHAGTSGEAPAQGRVRSYYAGPDFSLDLFEFVRSDYLKTMSRYPHLVETLVELEAAMYAFGDKRTWVQKPEWRRPRRRETLGVDAVPVVANGVKLIRVAADYKRLMGCLSRGQRLDHIPPGPVALALLKAGNLIKVLQLSSVTDRLLRVCDGSLSMRDIAGSFSAAEKINGVPMTKASLYGLSSLIDQGLIEVKAA